MRHYLLILTLCAALAGCDAITDVRPEATTCCPSGGGDHNEGPGSDGSGGGEHNEGPDGEGKR